MLCLITSNTVSTSSNLRDSTHTCILIASVFRLWSCLIGRQIWQPGHPPVAKQSQTHITQWQTPWFESGRGPLPHLISTVSQLVSCHFILSSQLIKELNHWMSEYCNDEWRQLPAPCSLHHHQQQQQPLPEPSRWQRGQMGLLLHTEEMTWMCFPQHQMYSSGAKFRSVSQTAPPHLILSDAHVYSGKSSFGTRPHQNQLG